MAKLIVVDASGKYLRDLGPDGVTVGEVVGIGDTPGPVLFKSGSVWRKEVNPPFYISGDAGGVPNPWGVVAGATIRIEACAGPDYQMMDITIPVKAAVVWTIIGPADADGPTNQSLDHYWITGRNQNININAAGDFLIEEVVSELAWDDRPTTPGAVTPSMFRGQGAYAQGRNRLVFRGVLFRQNGWPGPNGFALNRPKQKDIFHHGAYINGVNDLFEPFCDVWFDQCYFDENCAMAAKVMRNARFTGNLIHANAIAIQAIYGNCNAEDNVFYRGAYNWNGSDAWFGNGVGDFYCPTVFRNNLIVGGPLNIPATGDKVFNNGVVKLNRKHGQYDTPGGKLTIVASTVRGWKGDLIGGDAKNNVTGAFTIDNRPPLTLVLPDPRIEIRAGSTVKSTVERHIALVREAAR